jgi:hypothetical protein
MFALALLAGLLGRPDLLGLDARPCPTRAMRIPFAIDPATQPAVQSLRLLASTDRGRSWQVAAQAAPSAGAFDFRAPADGLYWLAVQTVAADGQATPPPGQLRPDLKLRVVAPTPPPAAPLPLAPPPAPLPPAVTTDPTVAELRKRIAELERRLAAVEGRRPVVPPKLVNYSER